MKENNDTIKDRFGDTAEDFIDLAELRIASFKLKALERLATLSNSIFTTFILLLLGSFVMLFVTVALTMLLAAWLESMLIAVLIMSGVFILVTIVVYAKRKTLFLDNMVKVWSKTLFDKTKD